MSAAILSSVFEAGPIVQTILVRLIAVSKVHPIACLVGLGLITRNYNTRVWPERRCKAPKVIVAWIVAFDG